MTIKIKNACSCTTWKNSHLGSGAFTTWRKKMHQSKKGLLTPWPVQPDWGSGEEGRGKVTNPEEPMLSGVLPDRPHWSWEAVWKKGNLRNFCIFWTLGSNMYMICRFHASQRWLLRCIALAVWLACCGSCSHLIPGVPGATTGVRRLSREYWRESQDGGSPALLLCSCATLGRPLGLSGPLSLCLYIRGLNKMLLGTLW